MSKNTLFMKVQTKMYPQGVDAVTVCRMTICQMTISPKYNCKFCCSAHKVVINDYWSSGLPNAWLPNDNLPNDSLPNKVVINDYWSSGLPYAWLPNDNLPNDSLPNDRLSIDRLPNDRLPNDSVEMTVCQIKIFQTHKWTMLEHSQLEPLHNSAYGRLQALPANTRVGWKWPTVTGILAYCLMVFNTNTKRFIKYWGCAHNTSFSS